MISLLCFHILCSDSKLFLKVYTTLSLIASNFDPISGIELPPGSARVLQPWECAYLVDLKSNTTLHTIYEGWQSTPNYFRSERSTLSKSVFYPSTWIPKKECNITICGLEFGERYGCKDVTEWGGNLSTSGVRMTKNGNKREMSKIIRKIILHKFFLGVFITNSHIRIAI